MDRWIAVDFDGTLHDDSRVAAGHVLGRPFPGAKEAMELIASHDLGPYIFTVRGDHPYLRDWLRYFEIPYVGVGNVKLPNFVAFIDDRAIRFRGSWPQITKEIFG